MAPLFFEAHAGIKRVLKRIPTFVQFRFQRTLLLNILEDKVSQEG